MKTNFRYIEKVVNLLNPQDNQFLTGSLEEAEKALRLGDPKRVREIDGQFAIAIKDGVTVRMARSIGRPMRYFLAKRTEGPCLIIAERMDEIVTQLQKEGLSDQFHPSYTRMVPAHHITSLSLIGCPDPSPTYDRFFDPERNVLEANLDIIGNKYINALRIECEKWLQNLDEREPIGVLFSGGIDSGAVFLILYHLLLSMNRNPGVLKAFTLSVQGGSDVAQAHDFLSRLDLNLFLEVIEVGLDDIDFKEAIRITEDYKELDIQAATMATVLCKEIRSRYPDWLYLADGDGGDENLKDYPIEDNPELTIRSVLSNLMLYQEGWGVDSVKHSLTYSGGQSRGHVRTYNTAKYFGFKGFSPFSLPNVIEIAEGIPFIELTNWDHQKLYELKGEVVRRGIKSVTGYDMPVMEKKRFQNGAVSDNDFQKLFPENPMVYRKAVGELF